MRLIFGRKMPSLSRCVVAIGMFDGCHNGHKRVIRAAVAEARARGCPCVVWTYSRHPLSLLAPERAPLMLQSLSQRLAGFRELGVDIACVRPFSQQEADLEPEAFVRALVAKLGMRAVVIGHSNTFGKAARGTPALLSKQGAMLGFETRIVDTLYLGKEKVNSSAIRDLIERGKMGKAAAMLGRCYSLEGQVVAGRRFGRRMGFPTINIDPPRGRLLPRRGVYAGWADIEGGRHPCVMNLGNKPTVNGSALSLEAHLLDFEGDLYGKAASLRFFAYLRPEVKFASVEDLRNALSIDEKKARSVLL